MPSHDEAGDSLTLKLVSKALALRFETMPAEVQLLARDCLLDWLACSLAALDEPVAKIVCKAAHEEGGNEQATILGKPKKLSMLQAALVNGTASHAFDYDDVNLAVPGHMSAAILPGLVALAEHHSASPTDFLAAFTAGYETACRIGMLVEPAQYNNGFHTTATIGCLGSAIACAHLLKLSPVQACHAMGLAATQSAGLKIMFGSMAKPLHAGLASQAGLRSALLAKEGLTARTDVLECDQGFAKVHGSDFHPDRAMASPPNSWHLLSNLFKFHAACYSTHSTIEAVQTLRRENNLKASQIERITVTAGEGCCICNIQLPTTGLEAKFSLRATAAFAVLAIDTADLKTWDRVNDADVVAVRDKVQVSLIPGMTLSESNVTIKLTDGRELRNYHDCGVPVMDKFAQTEKLLRKFTAITSPVIGISQSKKILDMLKNFDRQNNLHALMTLCRENSFSNKPASP